MIKKNLFAFYIFLFFGFLVLTLRLFQLTVIKGAYYRQLAEENRIKVIREPAPRGIIYDRKGRVLTRNTPVYKSCPAAQLTGCWLISREEALKLEAEGKEAEIQTEIGREYPYGPVLAHVVGYLGEVSEDELKLDRKLANTRLPSLGSEATGGQAETLSKTETLKLGDLIGRTGVEQAYDCWLRGTDGGELVEVDTEGQVIKTIGKKEPVSGRSLTLSIDAELQKTAFEALEGKKGAIVASDPETGEILALASSPSFNSNLFESCQSASWRTSCQAEIEKVLNDPDQPLFNRAISGLYPPGSTFKIITAAAGLEEGKIDKDFEIDDPGIIFIGLYKYANWYFTQYGRKEGLVNIVKAIQRSTDTFFYKVGEMVGIEALKNWAEKFGSGQTLNIDLSGEATGLVPGPEWKEKVKGEPWFLGNTYHLSIGQGDILTTPLQVNAWTAVIANGGKLCQPHLAKMSNVKAQMSNVSCKSLGLKSKTLSLIQEGMERACAPGGTGWPLFNFSPPVACKTGTAEYGDPQDRTHAWITVFAPLPSETLVKESAYTEPEIAITVLVEGGGEGSSVAGPIAKKILEEWFEK